MGAVGRSLKSEKHETQNERHHMGSASVFTPVKQKPHASAQGLKHDPSAKGSDDER